MTLVILSAVVFQLTAALLSFRLIRLTGRKLAWSLVSLALLLMSLRRLFSLVLILNGHSLDSFENYNEINGLLISFLMLAGIAGVSPLFKAIRQSEQGHREARQLLTDILNSIPQAVFWKDRQGVYLGCNQIFAAKAGYDKPAELIGLSDAEINWPPDAADSPLTDAHELVKLHSIRTLKLSDDTRWIDMTQVPLTGAEGQTLGVIGVFEDITPRIQAEQEIKKFEEHLHQVQKLESIGTLAGGIAHDFNNILTSMIGFSELAQMKQACQQPVDYELGQILKASLRARDLVKQILTFSRQAIIKREPLKLLGQLEEIMRFIRASLPASIEIEQDLAVQDIDLVLADAIQLHQILMNLCTNAAQAMHGSGLIAVKLTKVALHDEASLQYKGLNPGDYYRLSVTDNGAGIPDEHLDKIFEPFFTTKNPGEGTGMGLAVVHGIVKDMGGAIAVYSELGKGTTFNLLLPQYTGEPAGAELNPLELQPGNGRILLVDDEEDIVTACRGILERLGYSVASTVSPLEALTLFGAAPDKFDCVLTDMTMPRMTGLELSQAMLKIRPNIPIILCTGFCLGLNNTEIQDAGIKNLLIKPMIASELSATVHRVIHPDKPLEH